MKINKFLGLANKKDPLKDKAGYLKNAINVDIDDLNNVRRRDGFVQTVAGANVTSSYNTKDKSEAFFIDSGVLKSVANINMPMATGLGDGKYSWDNLGKTTFLYGEHQGIINNGEFIPWEVPMHPQPQVTKASGNNPPGRYLIACAYQDKYGREGGTNAPLVMELTETGSFEIHVTQIPNFTVTIYISPVNAKFLYEWINIEDNSVVFDGSMLGLVYNLPNDQIGVFPVPTGGETICAHESKVYVAEYQPKDDKTIIWFSKPFSFHWFDKVKDYLVIEGKVNAMVSTLTALVIGTESGIYYHSDERTQQVAYYGVPEGAPYAYTDDGFIFMYTNNGICRIDKFENLTENVYTFPISSEVNSAIVEQNGFERLINLLGDETPAKNTFRS